MEFEAELVKGDEDPLAALAAVLLCRSGARRRSGGASSRPRWRPSSEIGRTSKRSERWTTARRAEAPAGRGRCDDGGGRGARRGCGRRFERRACRTERATTEDGVGAADRVARATATATTFGDDRGLPSTSDVVSETVDEAVPPDIALVVGKTPGVAADDHLAEAGRKVMRFHLARMLAREAGTRDGRDPEELHAMRVATRRQRAAWRVFGASFRDRPDAALPQRTARDRGRVSVPCATSTS